MPRLAGVLEVARKLVCYLLAVDRSRQPFQLRTAPSSPTEESAGTPAPPTDHAETAPRSSASRVHRAAAKTTRRPG
jgi:hypothetical protein